MHRKAVFLLLLLVLPALTPLSSRSQTTESTNKYRLDLVYIFDGDKGKTEYIFVIGNSGFKSVASLKRFLENVPSGSILEWAPGCDRFGDEPLLSSEKDMAEFIAFCKKRNIKFILIPSG